MKRDACLEILDRHITDEIVVAVYSAAAEWLVLNKRPLKGDLAYGIGHGKGHGQTGGKSECGDALTRTAHKIALSVELFRSGISDMGMHCGIPSNYFVKRY